MKVKGEVFTFRKRERSRRSKMQ